MLINRGSAPPLAPHGGAAATAAAGADGGARCETLGDAVSRQNVELVRRLYAELASEGSTEEFERRMSDDALGRFLDPEIEWVPVTESLLAVDSYRGFDGVRRFWGEFLSAWQSYRVETLRFDDAGDRVAVVVHIVARTHELEVDETRSSLLTVRHGRVVRVQSYAHPDGARQAAGSRHRRNAGSAASRETQLPIIRWKNGRRRVGLAR
jgi:ketosteroid isomerase-like protein